MAAMVEELTNSNERANPARASEEEDLRRRSAGHEIDAPPGTKGKLFKESTTPLNLRSDDSPISDFMRLRRSRSKLGVRFIP
jgi:hypothetical protein